MEGALKSDADIARHRRLYCPSYQRCLDVSIRAGWDGFTCLHCALRHLAPEGPSSAAFATDRRRPTDS